MKRFIPRPWQLRGLLNGTITQLRLPVETVLGPGAQWSQWDDGGWRAQGRLGDIPAEWRNRTLYPPLTPGEPRWIAERAAYYRFGWHYLIDGPGKWGPDVSPEVFPSAARCPREASRATLTPTSCRIERVAETSEEDAVRCGFEGVCHCGEGLFEHELAYQGSKRDPLGRSSSACPGFKDTGQCVAEFHEQWQSDYPGTYDGGCWVYDVKVEVRT